MTFLEKLEFLMKKNNIKNIKRLAEQSEIPRSTIDNFYIHGYSNMKLSTFKKLCDFFQVTMDCMARDEVTEIEYYHPNKKDLHISQEEALFLKCYRASDEMHKGLARCAVGADEKEAEKQTQNVG
ncbi:MAG: helix-turn-helix transcriptional regulator [Lachnospiraceae bacterium]|nr:helix-turn-helix transcriptional regulator [Lachnospiraceae bacterium]